MCLLCIASFRGPPIGGQDSDGVSNRRSVLYTLCLFEAFPSRGNEKIGGTGYCVTYDTDSQSCNVLASPLGEEGHEVAKGVQANWIHRGAPRPANPVRRHPAKSVCTRVRMIMILDVDVTAERRHYNTHRPLKGKRLTTFCASLALLQNVFAVHLRAIPQPSARRAVAP